MILLELLHLMDSMGGFEPTIDGSHGFLSIDCIPESDEYIIIAFMCEEETWIHVSIYSPILVPWYGCRVKAIDPEDNYSIRIWLDTEKFLMDNWPEWINIKDKSDDRNDMAEAESQGYFDE